MRFGFDVNRISQILKGLASTPIRISQKQSNGNAPKGVLYASIGSWRLVCPALMWVQDTRRGAFSVARFDFFGQCESLINVERVTGLAPRFFVSVRLESFIIFHREHGRTKSDKIACFMTSALKSTPCLQ